MLTKDSAVAYIIIFISLGPLIVWWVNHINSDLHFDEIMSLEKFAIVDYITSLTYYPVTNNHIFFNLINNIISRIFGVHDIYHILDHTYILRIFQAILSLITILYSFLLIKRFFNKSYAFIVVIILITTIPFLNISLQLRGYNMSMMFFVMIIYYSWLYMKVEKTNQFILLIIISVLFVYTIPSNLYFLLSIYFTIGFEFIFDIYRFHKYNDSTSNRQIKYLQTRRGKNYIRLFVSWIIVCTVTLIIYFPVLNDLIGIYNTQSVRNNRFFVFTKMLPDIVYYFFSERWIFFILIASGIWLMFRKKIPGREKFISLLTIFFLSFFLFFLHNKYSPDRTFSILIPVFAILLSLCIIYNIALLIQSRSLKIIFVLLVTIYTMSNYLIRTNNNEKEIITLIESGKRHRRIYKSYFHSKTYNPKEIAQIISKDSEEKPLVLMAHEIDWASLIVYLKKLNIPSYSIVQLRKKNHFSNNTNYSHIAKLRYTPDSTEVYKISKQSVNSDQYFRYRLLFENFKKSNSEMTAYLVSANVNLTNNALREYGYYDAVLIDSSGFVNIWRL